MGEMERLSQVGIAFQSGNSALLIQKELDYLASDMFPFSEYTEGSKL